MLTNFIKDDGVNLIFTGYCLEIYIPERYFDSNMAYWEGDAINTFGLVYCAVLDSKMHQNNPVELINLPTPIYLYPRESEVKELILIPESPYKEEKYMVLRFYKGDTIMPSDIQRDSSNVENFLKLMCAGKIGPNIPYNKLLEIWEKNLEINNIKLGVAASILELIISVIYRSYDDPAIKFSEALAKNPKLSQYRYRTANIREICSRSSTFSALTYEDMDTMITTSLNMNNYNKKQAESPLEKLKKM